MSGMVAGRVVAVWRHPVKSLQGESLEFCNVGVPGLAGDRAYGVRDGLTGRVMSAKREPRLLLGSARSDGSAVVVTLPDGWTYAVDDPALGVAMSDWLGQPVVVVAAATTRPTADPFMDGCALHLLSTATLTAARDVHAEGDWSPRRFRPNLVLEVAGIGPVEDGWVGSSVAVGTVGLEVVSRTIRCPMTSMAQPGLDADPRILATTDELTGQRLGVYARVSRAGRVTVGDRVSVIEPV